MNSFIRILTLGAILVVSSCATQDQQSLSDETHSALLVGTWIAEYSYDEGNEIRYGEKTYHPDGTAQGFISGRVRQPSGQYEEVMHKSFHSRWRIENRIVIIWDVRYSPSDPEADYQILRDKIISIDEREAEFESLPNGSVFTRTRKTGI